ncbi:MAG TPA: thioredoxin domain-containing protein [Nitrolancea sp.]|jgi:protein-disulfide isomerase|nr:thioredoxin domain-containing protein [Nitrolancea sp.]
MSSQSSREKRESRRAARQQAAVRATKRKKQVTVFGVAAVAIVIALGLILVPRLGGGNTSAITVAPDPTANLTNNGATLGNANAPVKVVEWANYQCPYCDAFWTSSETTFIQQYISTGKVHFQYNDLTFGWQESIDASEAATCAGNQGKFWQYHDTLFKNQKAENSGGFSRSRLKTMASDMGLDMTKFNQCFDGHQTADAVQASDNAAAKQNINSTPTFFVNGQQVNYTGYGSVKAAIDAALASQ